jgi:hypothetical protein
MKQKGTIMRIAVINDQRGTSRIHAADCRDVAREATRFRDEAWVIEAANRHDVNVAVWGDVASDNLESGSPEWHAECDWSADYGSLFLPCCSQLPPV